jgi:hypothetical protein
MEEGTAKEIKNQYHISRHDAYLSSTENSICNTQDSLA